MKFDGLFQIWEYRVSHGALLLRRNKDDSFPTRVDIFFTNVKLIQLPTTFVGVRIADVTFGEVPGGNAIVLASDLSYRLMFDDGSAGYVACGSMTVDESTLSYNEPSKFLT